MNHYGEDYKSSGHLYLIHILGISCEQRDEIIEKLAEQGVTTNVHYKPLPMRTAYKAYGWDIKVLPNACDYYHKLSLHTKLTDEDVKFKAVVKEYI